MVVTAPPHTRPFLWSKDQEQAFLEAVLLVIGSPDKNADPLRSIILERLKSELSNHGGDRSLDFQSIWPTVCRDELLVEETDQYEERLEVAKSEWTNVYAWAEDEGLLHIPTPDVS